MLLSQGICRKRKLAHHPQEERRRKEWEKGRGPLHVLRISFQQLCIMRDKNPKHFTLALGWKERFQPAAWAHNRVPVPRRVRAPPPKLLWGMQ